MVSYVLVVVDGLPTVVKVNNENPALYVERNYCSRFKAERPIRCYVQAVYDSSYLETMPRAHVIVRCDGKIIKDNLIVLEDAKEVEDVRELYEQDYPYCNVTVGLHFISELEYIIAHFYQINLGLDTTAAIARSHAVVAGIVDLTEKR